MPAAFRVRTISSTLRNSMMVPGVDTTQGLLYLPFAQENNKTLVSFPTRVLAKAGNDLLSRYSHYHGPQVLNGRVRNGNGCGHLGMVTGKTNQWLVVSGQWLVKATATPLPLWNIKKAAEELSPCMRSLL